MRSYIFSKKTLIVFCTLYGILFAFSESLKEFELAPEFIISLSFYVYIYIGLLALLVALAHATFRYFYNPEVRNVTICQFHRTVNYLPLYIAQQKGYFRAQGLSVNVIDGNGDDSTWDKVKYNHAQFGIADPTMMLEETSEKGKVIAAVVGRAALWGMTKKPIAPILNAYEFKEKVIAVYKSPSTAYMLMKYLLEQSHIFNHVTIREMMPGSEFSVLEDDSVDIMFVPEPMVTIAEFRGAHKVFSLSQHFGDFLITGLFTTEKYILEQPEIVQKVVNAFELALKFANANSTNAIASAKKEFTDLPPYAIEFATLNLLKENSIPNHTTVVAHSWTSCLRVRRKNDAASFPFTSYVDNSFALKAVAKIRT